MQTYSPQSSYRSGKKRNLRKKSRSSLSGVPSQSASNRSQNGYRNASLEDQTIDEIRRSSNSPQPGRFKKGRRRNIRLIEPENSSIQHERSSVGSSEARKRSAMQNFALRRYNEDMEDRPNTSMPALTLQVRPPRPTTQGDNSNPYQSVAYESKLLTSISRQNERSENSTTDQ